MEFIRFIFISDIKYSEIRAQNYVLPHAMSINNT